MKYDNRFAGAGLSAADDAMRNPHAVLEAREDSPPPIQGSQGAPVWAWRPPVPERHAKLPHEDRKRLPCCDGVKQTPARLSILVNADSDCTGFNLPG